MKLVYSTLFATLVAISSCKKEKDDVGTGKPKPELPQSSAVLSRKFFYPATSNSDSASFTMSKDSIILSGKKNENNQLILAVDVPLPKGHDFIQFTIDENKIKPGYTGEYAMVHALASGLRGDVQTSYRYSKDAYAYVELGHGNADGTLKVTAYDEKLKLLSGTYSFHINSFHDPKVGMNWVETQIDVKGSFENLQIK